MGKKDAGSNTVRAKSRKLKGKYESVRPENIQIAGVDYKLNLPTDHFSITQLTMVMRCARQYLFRYCEGMVIPPAIAMVEGSSHHKTVQSTNTTFIKNGKHLSVKDMEDIFCETFLVASKEVTDWEDESADKVISRGRKLINSYMQDFGKGFVPVDAEMEVKVNMAGVSMLGFVDMLDKDSLWDLKVRGRAPSKNEVREDVQLTFYAYATERDKVGQIIMKKTTIPGIEILSSWRDRSADSQWLMQLISDYVRQISAGIFPPCDPSSWVCCPRFCGYYQICRGGRKGK